MPQSARSCANRREAEFALRGFFVTVCGRCFNGVLQLRAGRSIRVRGDSRSYAASAAIIKNSEGVVQLKVRHHLGGGSVESAPPFGGGSVVMRQGKGGTKEWRSAPNDVAG